MTVLVSACLLGFPCRHDGKDKLDDRVLRRLAGEDVVPLCPEVAGGLPVPRPPSWQDGARVVDALGADVTAQFRAGAGAAVEAASRHGARLAILKENSPSCGVQRTGTASGRQPGRGLATAALAAAGVEVQSEEWPG